MEGGDIEVSAAAGVVDPAEPGAADTGVIDAAALDHAHAGAGCFDRLVAGDEDALDILRRVVGDQRLAAIRLVPHLDRVDPAAVAGHEGGDESLKVGGHGKGVVGAVPGRRVDQDGLDHNAVRGYTSFEAICEHSSIGVSPQVTHFRFACRQSNIAPLASDICSRFCAISLSARLRS